MLFLIARHSKPIAWFFFVLFYAELVLTPVVARAQVPMPKLYLTSTLPSSGIQSSESNRFFDPPLIRKLPVIGFEKQVLNGHDLSLPAEPNIGGPTQPEMTSFSSVNSGNMVDLFTGDFSYTIPLLDVGGYPVALGYNAGIAMDQEASWVGLGWNINPGTITRNLRGLPDDFNGDLVKKTANMKENVTVGVNAGADIEVAGFPKDLPVALRTDSLADYSKGLRLAADIGIIHNNYKGWGIERNGSVGIIAGKFGKQSLSAGLSLSNSSMEGITLNPSVTFSGRSTAGDNTDKSTGMTISIPYNNRAGLQALQSSYGVSYYGKNVNQEKPQNFSASNNWHSSLISFYKPSSMPSIKMPYVSDQFTFTGKVGLEKKVNHPSLFVTGHVSEQYIYFEDTMRSYPAYGYLNYQNGSAEALLDYNREKELPYREKPAYPHIAVPAYTYDAFTISGEGTGGMFRAYRSDIGFVHDHYMRTRSSTSRGGLDIGIGDAVHVGFDVGVSNSQTWNRPWLGSNTMAEQVRFRQNNGLFQAAYFRNPGEKSINSKQFYDAIGGDDLVAVNLYQSPFFTSEISATSVLNRFRDKRQVGSTQLNTINAVKQERDKRTQVISYLSAREADAAAIDKYINNYTPNLFDPSMCGKAGPGTEVYGTGLKAELFLNQELKGKPVMVRDNEDIYFPKGNTSPWGQGITDRFSIRWTGRIKAPVTGKYKFEAQSDDGFRMKVNGIVVAEDWRKRFYEDPPAFGFLNLEANQFYDIEIELFDYTFDFGLEVKWTHPNAPTPQRIPIAFLYPKAVDTFNLPSTAVPGKNILVKEKRENDFRKANHISEVTVLNADGRRYVYGIPVYNLIQKDVTFAADHTGEHPDSALVNINFRDNTTFNTRGRDNYFSKEEMPAYAHSFLLTGILSDDYSDLTGDGITEDDPGNAVKFNYSKLSGVRNPFKWRTPFSGTGKAAFSEGLKTDYRDDKGSYLYGEKELWYLHTIESKTMIATFITSSRLDMPEVDELGYKIYTAAARKLDSIRLYNKADFVKYGTNATPVKTVHFRYSYKLCKGVKDAQTGKLTLDSLWFTYNGVHQQGSKSNPYLFSYHQNNPGYKSQHTDRWGAYKDPVDNMHSTVANLIRNPDFPYSLQDSVKAARNAGAWNLDSIYLPSGGSMKIEYESDDYGFVQNKTAMQLFNLAGLGLSNDYAKARPALYSPKIGGGDDYLYVFIKVPVPVTSAKDAYNLYLSGIDKLYFKTFVKMPKDNYSNGKTHEYIPCYARIDKSLGSYGVSAPDVIWVKLESIDLNGNEGGQYSPLAKAATQFLRLNLPSKAYPGSETGEQVDLVEAIQLLASMATNILEMFTSFDVSARGKGWACDIDLKRSHVRLLNPARKKYGGGHRVKRVTVYDNWDKMTNQRAAKYGQEYTYTSEELVNDKKTLISSGVAAYEPFIGGDENPFHMPIEYIDQPSLLVPMSLGYSEEPLGESFFPSPGVGYSSVKVRTINYLKKKSANGFQVTNFYTARDYPVYTDRTLIDAQNKKRYKPAISNYFRINAYHFLTLTQGFKIELNDMHGKLRSTAMYPENAPNSYTSCVEYFYRTEEWVDGKRLSNTVMVMKPDGQIDTAALIGKDVELMMDMREQESLVEAGGVQLNSDMFSIPVFPGFLFLPMALNAYQREKNIFRSVATVKLIQRYGILDSVLAIDKGSKISTKDLLYDSETGDVLMTRTQNEFDDYIYNVSYPSHWAYKSMGPASRNIDAVVHNMTIRDGILQNMTPAIDTLFSGGDEILVAGKQKTGGLTCAEEIASFPNYNKIWCIDSSDFNGGQRSIYFIDRFGKPYTAFDISMKVIRSGNRNIFAGIGGVSCMVNPLQKDGSGNYQLVIDENSKVIAASANEYEQAWKIQDIFRQKESLDCLAKWEPNGKTSCKKVGGVNNGVVIFEETDINPNSPTFGTVRTVEKTGYCAMCPTPAKWAPQANLLCEYEGMTPPDPPAPGSGGASAFVMPMTSGGPGPGGSFIFTGNAYRLWKDTASCSVTFGHFKYVLENACQDCTPATCTPCGQSKCNTGNNLQKCINGVCQDPGPIYYCISYRLIGAFKFERTFARKFSDGTASGYTYKDTASSACSVGSPATSSFSETPNSDSLATFESDDTSVFSIPEGQPILINNPGFAPKLKQVPDLLPQLFRREEILAASLKPKNKL